MGTKHLREGWTARKFSSFADADAQDLSYWSQIPEGERMLRAWELSLEQYRLAGLVGEDEPRLCRTAVRIQRR